MCSLRKAAQAGKIMSEETLPVWLMSGAARLPQALLPQLPPMGPAAVSAPSSYLPRASPSSQGGCLCFSRARQRALKAEAQSLQVQQFLVGSSAAVAKPLAELGCICEVLHNTSVLAGFVRRKERVWGRRGQNFCSRTNVQVFEWHRYLRDCRNLVSAKKYLVRQQRKLSFGREKKDVVRA